jgi:peptidoglycan/xylan/chitin deacetylase (PgdA/CDA1 family)
LAAESFTGRNLNSENNRVKGKKIIISEILQRAKLDRVLRGIQSPHLMIFNFHRIKEDHPQEILFDEEVYGPTVGEFRSQVRWLKENTHLISEDELLSSIREKRILPPHSTMITFDDGYIDNFTLAYPVLKELRAPAIFFIPTESIEERKLGWWDLITYIVKKTDRPEVVADRRGTRQRLLLKMKLQKAEQSAELVNDFARQCGIELPSKEICSRELMTWEQVKIVSDNGITIGSHTHTQRVLATLNAKEQIEEFQRSKAELESLLKKPVRTLAYPVGGYEHFTRETKKLAQQCGYEAAFSFTHEINDARTLDIYGIRRLVPPEELSLYVGTVALPQFFVKRRSPAEAKHQA